ncbi:MAG TPA: histidine kinase [Saprospiraceae bacterium]|jgi:two-component system NarL family sensor kinase|nr:histidine kinase [Saprospiraceae bacterium]
MRDKTHNPLVDARLHLLWIIVLSVFFFLSKSPISIAQTDSTKVNTSVKNLLYHALKEASKTNNNELIAEIYQRLGAYYESESRQDSAINFYQKSTTLFKSLGKELLYHDLLVRLGILNDQVFNYKFAISYLKEATSYYKKNKMYLPYVKAMNQLGEVYSHIDDDVNARQCFIATLEVNNNILKDTHLIIENKILIIQNDIKTDNLDRALSLAMHNNKVAQRFGNESMLAKTEYQLGVLYFKMQNLDKAKDYLEQAEPHFLKNEDYISLQSLYKLLTQSYIELGKKDSIKPTLDKYFAVVDKIKNTEIVKSSQEIAQKFDSEKKDEVIQQLENENELKTINSRQQKTIIYILIFSFLASILVVYLIYNNYVNRLKTNQIIAQQQSELRDKQLKQVEQESQIKAMESMLMGQEAERNRIGKELHDSLGATLSTIKLQMSSSPGNDHPEGHSMKKAKEMIDEACEEVRKISRDMMPITLTKYGLHTALEELIDKYNFEGGPNVIYQAFGIIQHDNKDLDLFTYRIIQELVNNCIKHAQAQEIIVQINYLEGLMIITVEDDGNGFDFENTQYQGMGLKNVEYRAQYLKGKFSVESSPGVGTIMVVEIPINKNHQPNQSSSFT